jgi:hypothetical protein
VEVALRAWIAVGGLVRDGRARLKDELGEGVISTAIVVLIMALIGLAMWQLFDRVFTDAGTKVESNVNQIG